MKKMLYVLVIKFLSFTIYSCAKKSDSSSGSSTTELEGTWVVSCYASGSKYLIKTITVSGTSVVEKYEYHLDSSCATDYDTWETTYTSLAIGDEHTDDTYGSSGGTGHKFTMTVDTNTYTPLSASNVTWSNDNSFCGESDWVLNTPQSIAGKNCGSGTFWSKGITTYGVYKLDGSKLHWGLNDEDYPSSLNTDSSRAWNKQFDL